MLSDWLVLVTPVRSAVATWIGWAGPFHGIGAWRLQVRDIFRHAYPSRASKCNGHALARLQGGPGKFSIGSTR